MSSAKIVIIGAGASGIACTTRLLEFGFQNIQLLEAELRIGGRIHTIPFADNVIDLGAQWCHGEKDNIVYELAQRHDLLESTGDVYESYQCIRSNGEVVPDDVAQRLKNIVNDSLITRQLELRHCNGSLGSYLTHKYYEMLLRPENADIDAEVAKEFFENYQKFENSVEASDHLDEVSGRGYLEYWECEGDILLNWRDRGFLEFLRLLMRVRRSGAIEPTTEYGMLENYIKLGKRAVQINWQRNDCGAEVKCADGSAYVADHVIITASLGVLKEEHLRLFEPRLPVAKQRAIDGLAFGTVNKIFIEFPERFWPAKWTGFTTLWRAEDLEEIRGTPRSWLEDVFGFYCVNFQDRILSGWIIGANGRYMESLPEDEVLAGCMFLFRKFLPWTVPEPVNFRCSSWWTNPNFRGSYSFRSMLTEEVGTSARELAEPLAVVTASPKKKQRARPNATMLPGMLPAKSAAMLPAASPEMLTNGDVAINDNGTAGLGINDLHEVSPQSRCDKPIVLFAGEATSEHYYSTVHGAVEAGWREAQRLADFYGLTTRKIPLLSGSAAATTVLGTPTPPTTPLRKSQL